MDVYEAAANMMAFSDFIVAAAHAVYGNEAEVRADVKGFRQGSFATDVVFHVAGAAATIWSANADIGGLLTVIKESLGLYRFLGGEPPKAVEPGNKNTVEVTNNNGEVTIIQAESMTVVLGDKPGQAVERFVGHALKTSGVTSVSVEDSGRKEPLAIAHRAEAEFYHAIGVERALPDQFYQMALTVEQPNFKAGNKWRLSGDGRAATYEVEDKVFLKRVDNGEPFRKGDVLICEVRQVQSITRSGKIQTKRFIHTVIDHRNAPTQMDLAVDLADKGDTKH